MPTHENRLKPGRWSFIIDRRFRGDVYGKSLLTPLDANGGNFFNEKPGKEFPIDGVPICETVRGGWIIGWT